MGPGRWRKNKVGICASPRERGTKHRARGRDGADARGPKAGSRGPFDRRSGDHDPWIPPVTPRGAMAPRLPPPSRRPRAAEASAKHVTGSRASHKEPCGPRRGRGDDAAGTGRASRGALTLRELGRWTSAGALTASVTAAGPMVVGPRARAVLDAVSGTCPSNLCRDQRDYHTPRAFFCVGGFFLLQCEGALSRPMASIRARRRAMSVLHEVWALARLTRGSRGVGTGSGGATFRESDGIQKSILRGLAITQRTVRSAHSTRDEWSGWTTAVTQRDVDRVLRRVNRRIETGVVALPKGSRCLEDDHSWREADVELEPDFTAPCAAHQTTHPRARGTLVFLHGFGDDAKHWREFTELLVRGIPGGFDVVLPAAPNRQIPNRRRAPRGDGVVRAQDEAHARGRVGLREGRP